MLNKYNSIAAFYPTLSKLVFGNGLFQIQKQAIDLMPYTGKLLIVGGGNGLILPYLFKTHPLLQIEYLEASSKMIQHAKRIQPLKQQITYVHSDSVSSCSPDIDFIFAPFFFDLFSSNETNQILNHLGDLLQKTHRLYVTDFNLHVVPVRLIRQLQIKLSIIFFRLTVGHKLNYLPSLFKNIENYGYKSLSTSYLKNYFLRLEVFENK